MADRMAVDDVAAIELFGTDMDDFRDTVLDDRLLEEDYTPYTQGAMSQTATTAGTATHFVPQRNKPAVKSLVYKSKTGGYVGPEACSGSIEEYLYCQVCSIYLMNMKTAVLHYKGKGHQRSLNQLAEKMGVLTVPLLTEDVKQAKSGEGVGWKDAAQMASDPGSQSLYTPIQHIDATLLEKSKNVFVDELGRLWGPERYARTLGQFKNCTLCDVKASSFKTAKEHYTGVKHIKKLKNLASHKGLEFKKIGNCVYEATARGPVERDDDPLGVKEDAEMYAATKRKGGPSGGGAAKKSRIDQKSFCDICNLELNSDAVAAMHYEGKKHKRKLELARLQQEGVKDPSSKLTLDLVGSGILFCPKCDVMCMSEEQLKQHYEGKQHKAALQAENEKFEKSKKAAEEAAGTVEEPEDKEYGCRICGIKSNSKNQYLEHLQSKKHLKKFEQYSEEKLGKRLDKVKKQNFGQKHQPMLDAGRRAQWPNWDKPWQVPQESDWLDDWNQWTDQNFGYNEGLRNEFGEGYDEGWEGGQLQEGENFFSEDDWNVPRRSDQLGRGRGPMRQERDVRGDGRPQRPRDGGAPMGRQAPNKDGGRPRRGPPNRDEGVPRRGPPNRDGGAPRGPPSDRGNFSNMGGGFGGGQGGFGSGDVNNLDLLNNVPADALIKVLSNLTQQLLGGVTSGGRQAPARGPGEINWTNDQDYQSYRDDVRESRGSSWGNSDTRRPVPGSGRPGPGSGRPGPGSGRRGKGFGRGFALR